MLHLEESEEMELVPLPSGRIIERWKAHEDSETLPLVCATLPIIGTNKAVELLRGSQKRVLPNHWIYWMSEHQKHTEKTPLEALRRGLREEVGYDLTKDYYDPHQSILISYENKGIKLNWLAHLYVVPIHNFSELTPDGKENVDLRVRPFNKIVEEALKKGSHYHRFKPESFLEALNYHTKHVLRDYSGKH